MSHLEPRDDQVLTPQQVREQLAAWFVDAPHEDVDKVIEGMTRRRRELEQSGQWPPPWPPEP
ncbi:hypothetical protein [Amycolatopsis sp. NPDC051903]|uniref:hypothetical protein n=1 Tax=Amycolatopsis sp. NPDC051903 TaxID=3363936 RepID=UPI00379A65F7